MVERRILFKVSVLAWFLEGGKAKMASNGLILEPQAGQNRSFSGTDAAPGLVPRSVELLFQTLRDRLITEPERKPKMFADCEPIDAKKRQEMQATKAALWKFLDTGVRRSLLKLNEVLNGSVCF